MRDGSRRPHDRRRGTRPTGERHRQRVKPFLYVPDLLPPLRMRHVAVKGTHEETVIHCRARGTRADDLARAAGPRGAAPAEPAVAQAAASGWHPSTPIQWAECGTTHKGECATLKVPIDWKKPSGPTLDLPVGRLKALDPAKRIGVLVVHPGGPGGSGINPFILNRAIPDSDPIRQYFDLVSLDPRGVGRSTQAVCSEDLVDRAPATYPAGEAEYQALLQFNADLSKDCREQTGPLFDHVDTTSAARDIDAIRVALGERKISFFAISYGTQVGQQYAELFPGNIRAMAVDSNMDHSITRARPRRPRPPPRPKWSTTPIPSSGVPTGSGTSRASPSSTDTGGGLKRSPRTRSSRRSGPTWRAVSTGRVPCPTRSTGSGSAATRPSWWRRPATTSAPRRRGTTRPRSRSRSRSCSSTRASGTASSATASAPTTRS
ncbi:hypothetical protein GCM10023075_30060 [Streptosporangium album]